MIIRCARTIDVAEIKDRYAAMADRWHGGQSDSTSNARRQRLAGSPIDSSTSSLQRFANRTEEQAGAPMK